MFNVSSSSPDGTPPVKVLQSINDDCPTRTQCNKRAQFVLTLHNHTECKAKLWPRWFVFSFQIVLLYNLLLSCYSCSGDVAPICDLFVVWERPSHAAWEKCAYYHEYEWKRILSFPSWVFEWHLWCVETTTTQRNMKWALGNIWFCTTHRHQCKQTMHR